MVFLHYFLVIYGFSIFSLFTLRLGLGEGSRLLTIGYRSAVILMSFVIIAKITLLYYPKRLNGCTKLIIAFWFLYLLRLLYDTYLGPHYMMYRPPIEYWMYAIGLIIIPMLSLSWTMSPKQSRMAYWGAFWSTLIAFTLVLILYRGMFSLSGGFQTELKSTESIVSTINLGYGGSMLFLFGIWGYIRKQEKWSLNMVAILIGAIVMVGCQNRGSVVATLFAVAFFFMANRGATFKKLLDFMFVFVGFIIGFFYLGDALFGRFTHLWEQLQGASDQEVGRLEFFYTSMNHFLSSPLYGTSLELQGVSNELGVAYPHNIVLESLISMGIPGGILILFIIYVGLRNAYDIFRHNPEMGWVCMIFLRGFGESMFSNTAYTLMLFWYGWVMMQANKDNNIYQKPGY